MVPAIIRLHRILDGGDEASYIKRTNALKYLGVIHGALISCHEKD